MSSAMSFQFDHVTSPQSIDHTQVCIPPLSLCVSSSVMPVGFALDYLFLLAARLPPQIQQTALTHWEREKKKVFMWITIFHFILNLLPPVMNSPQMAEGLKSSAALRCSSTSTDSRWGVQIGSTEIWHFADSARVFASQQKWWKICWPGPAVGRKTWRDWICWHRQNLGAASGTKGR